MCKRVRFLHRILPIVQLVDYHADITFYTQPLPPSPLIPAIRLHHCRLHLHRHQHQQHPFNSLPSSVRNQPLSFANSHCCWSAYGSAMRWDFCRHMRATGWLSGRLSFGNLLLLLRLLRHRVEIDHRIRETIVCDAACDDLCRAERGTARESYANARLKCFDP